MVWSGVWNAVGVLHAAATGLVVAFSIVHLLPVDLLVSLGPGAGLAMVFSLLLAAVLWNLGTWYLGLPASSSHTLIGSVLGVGLAASVGSAAGLRPRRQLGEGGPGAPLAGGEPLPGLLRGLARAPRRRRAFRSPELHAPAPTDRPPPLGVRALLVLACTGVSFAHGSNDGQKGIGLIMLILIGVLPAGFALDLATGPEPVAAAVAATRELDALLEREEAAGRRTLAPTAGEARDHADWRHVRLTPSPLAGETGALREALASIRGRLDGRTRLSDVPPDERWPLRADMLRARQALVDFDAHHASTLAPATRESIRAGEASLLRLTEYAPRWVPLGVALALGLGTMIGWRRIVVTVGEKIGGAPMSYAQGTTAQLVTAGTILAADVAGPRSAPPTC